MSKPRRALVVDDDRQVARTMGMLMESFGYEVALAYDGRTALDAAARVCPEVVLLDISLPDLSGHDVARAMRSEVWGQRLLLIAVTGWSQRADEERSKAVGFDHHLSKPFDVAHLERLVTRSGDQVKE